MDNQIIFKKLNFDIWNDVFETWSFNKRMKKLLSKLSTYFLFKQMYQ